MGEIDSPGYGVVTEERETKRARVAISVIIFILIFKYNLNEITY